MNKIRSYFNKEQSIVNELRKITLERCLILPSVNMSSFLAMFNIMNQSGAKCWTNNSDNSNFPPDFFSNEYHLMMDVMRVSEYEWSIDDGKVLNPLIVNETSYIYDMIQKAERNEDVNFSSVSIVQLSKNVEWRHLDHSYQQWLNGFTRVITRHNS